MKRLAFIFALLLANTVSGQPISDPAFPDLLGTAVTDPSKIRLMTADIQLATPGTSTDVGLDQIQYIAQSKLVTATAHGLVAGDVGKPLYGAAIYDDVIEAANVDWVLLQSVDANTIRVAPPGAVVSIATTLLDGGDAYSISTSGRHVYWDKSAGLYKAALPADSSGSADRVLTIFNVGTGTFTAYVATDGPPATTTDVIIRGTGTSPADDTRMAAAVAKLNAAGKGRLLVAGTLKLANNYSFTSAISIEGIPGTSPTIECVDLGGKLSWNGSYSPFSESTVAIDATAARASTIVVPTGTLVPGQWFFATCDDDLTGVTAHTPGTPHRPFEMHQVKESRGTLSSEDYIVFDDFIATALTTNPRIIEPTGIFYDISVRNLTFTWSGSTPPTGAVLDFRKCVGVVVDSCYWKAPSPCEVAFYYSANCIVTNCVFEDSAAHHTSEGYFVICGPVNNVLFTDSVAYGARHVFSTSGQTNSGARHGTARNVVVNNVVAHMNGTTSSSLVPFDTHAEGWGITFTNCHVNMPYEVQSPGGGSNVNRAFQTRSRNTIWRGCSAIGEGLTNGWFILGADATIDSCLVNGCWKGIVISQDTGTDSVANCTVSNTTLRNSPTNAEPLILIEDDDGHVIVNCLLDTGDTGINIATSTVQPDGIRIERCTFANFDDAGIKLTDGLLHRISHCEFVNCGTGSESKSHVYMAIDTTAIINNCNMSKGTNEFAVGGQDINSGDVVMTGCNLRDYTADVDSEDTGFDVLGAASATLNTETSPFNWVTP